jgi:hypothetical protein
MQASFLHNNARDGNVVTGGVVRALLLCVTQK